MIIPVYINNQEYHIHPRRDYIGEGSSAWCYKVDSDEGPLCVKIYNEDYLANKLEYQRYNKLVLNTFSKLATYTRPILLSKFLVSDEQGDFIGCAKDFVDKKGTVRPSISVFSLPTEEGIDCFRSIKDKIIIFNEMGIALGDWALYNVLYGSVQGDNSELFIVDDGDYQFSKYCWRLNNLQLNHLVEDLTEDYLADYGFQECFPNINSDIHATHCAIQFLEEIGEGHPTLGEGAIQYAKRRTK